MTYQYLEQVATADVAFEAVGGDLVELFISAADATMNVMIENLDDIHPLRAIEVKLQNRDADLLLFDLLQELIFYKDAERLLLRIASIAIDRQSDRFSLVATAVGEELDASRHVQRVDVKAVTLHRFTLEQREDGQWRALVILDV